MRIENLRRFHDQRHVPQTFANHRLPYRRGGQQRRERRAFTADAAVRKEEKPRTPAAAQRGSQLSQTAARARNFIWGGKSKVDVLYRTECRRKLGELRRAN